MGEMAVNDQWSVVCVQCLVNCGGRYSVVCVQWSVSSSSCGNLWVVIFEWWSVVGVCGYGCVFSDQWSMSSDLWCVVGCRGVCLWLGDQ